MKSFDKKIFLNFADVNVVFCFFSTFRLLGLQLFCFSADFNICQQDPVICPEIFSEMANSVDPDQNAPF